MLWRVTEKKNITSSLAPRVLEFAGLVNTQTKRVGN
jgi:hypothetical protein